MNKKQCAKFIPKWSNEEAQDNAIELLWWVWLRSDLDTTDATDCVEKIDDVIFAIEKLEKKHGRLGTKGKRCG